ncbi:MAG: hypothetical protein ACNA8W_26900, partial [Bradymonadaceae bacterium]
MLQRLEELKLSTPNDTTDPITRPMDMVRGPEGPTLPPQVLLNVDMAEDDFAHQATMMLPGLKITKPPENTQVPSQADLSNATQMLGQQNLLEPDTSATSSRSALPAMSRPFQNTPPVGLGAG